MTSIETQATEVLSLLEKFHNVLITGPPATGKSRLLAEVQKRFKGSSGPGYDPKGPVFIPEQPAPHSPTGIPSAEKKNRRVWHMTFQQTTKHRDFVGGFVPSTKHGDPPFRYEKGILYEAAEHAATPDGASLVVIDEINRGPAVAVFGDAIAAIESDKRLGPDGKETETTVAMHVRNVDDGTPRQLALPHHLYLVASMNEADTSVEALDVAFRRRFHPFNLVPDEGTIRDFFGLPSAATALPADPTKPDDYVEAAIQAWSAVNERVTAGRSEEFQLGHGVFLYRSSRKPADTAEAATLAVHVWQEIEHHVREVFFGQPEAAAVVFNASDEKDHYQLMEDPTGIAGSPRLKRPAIMATNIYALLARVAKKT